MRKSFDGLHTLVREHLELDAFAGHLFVFARRRRNQTRFRIQIRFCSRRVPGILIRGRRLRLLRRTAHDGNEVVHVETDLGVSRELPAWMVDASFR
jgi:IS66 Orf2 like protein